MTMAEPDELYTLRAQFALGHYGLALQESKQVARRPLSAALQAEREEYTVRALTALRQYSKIEEDDRPGKLYCGKQVKQREYSHRSIYSYYSAQLSGPCA